MRSRLLFWGIVGGLLLVSLGLLLKTFSPSSVTDTSNRTGDGHNDYQHRRGERRLSKPLDEGSAWDRLTISKPSPKADDLKTQAEIQNNISLLMKLYEEGADEVLLVKLDELISHYPQVTEYLALKGDYLYREGKWQEAEELIKKLIALDPDNLVARTTLGEVLAIRGNLEESQRVVEDVLKRDPTNKDALYGLMSVTELNGKPEQGFDKIKSTYLAFKNNVNASLAYADALQARNLMEERKRVLASAMVTNPQDSTVSRSLAWDAFHEQNFDEALRLAEISLARGGERESRIQTFNIIFQAAFGKKDFRRAEAALEHIRELDPDDESVTEQMELVKQAMKN